MSPTPERTATTRTPATVAERSSQMPSCFSRTLSTAVRTCCSSASRATTSTTGPLSLARRIANTPCPSCPYPLVHLCTTVHHQGLSSHEVTVRRTQKHYRAHQILRYLSALDGAGLEALLVLGGPGLALFLHTHGQPRGNGIHIDVVLPKLACQRARQPDHPGL